MTESEIAEHATFLAMVVASSDIAQGTQYSSLQAALESNRRLTDLARETTIILRQIASLKALHRKANARRVLHALIEATQTALDSKLLPIVNVRPVFSEEAWPEIYKPNGTRDVRPAG